MLLIKELLPTVNHGFQIEKYLKSMNNKRNKLLIS